MAADDEMMTTYRRADGELILGEYAWFAELPDECSDTPVEYVRQVWQLVDTTDEVSYPPVYDCDHVDCDDDAVSWIKQGDDWYARCVQHGGDPEVDR